MKINNLYKQSDFGSDFKNRFTFNLQKKKEKIRLQTKSYIYHFYLGNQSIYSKTVLLNKTLTNVLIKSIFLLVQVHSTKSYILRYYMISKFTVSNNKKRKGKYSPTSTTTSPGAALSR